MTARLANSARATALVVCTMLATAASAEILLLGDGSAASIDSGYTFAHPTMRSVVFISSESRQMAILPPAPVFVQPPPLLWRAPSPFPVYPPASVIGAVNSTSRPSNRDVTTYHLQRAHGFSQELFYRDTYLNIGLGTSPLSYWTGGAMPAYPPVVAGGNRPSNRDNTTYNLERAHRYSMDAYKKP